MKVGVDLVQVARISAMSSAAKSKVFHSTELANASDEHLAAVFAIKECCKKIFGAKTSWKSIEVTRSTSGAPQVRLSSSLQKQVEAIEASATHEQGFAAAVVVAIERNL